MGAGLTLYTCPKPFVGHIDIIQRNAIGSWKKLGFQPEVLLIGNENGAAEVARELNVRHIPDIECTSAGTPLVSDIFRLARENCDTEWLAFINADIILLDDFSDALRMLDHELEKNGIKRFFLTCQRTDIDISECIRFDDPDWKNSLRRSVETCGVKTHTDAIDIFLYSKGLFQNLPPFALGRTAWDNYLLWKAKNAGAAIIDASDAFLLVHQCHDYAHAGNWKNAWQGEEARRNQEMAHGCTLSIPDATTHALGRDGLREGKSSMSFSHARYIQLRMDLALKAMQKGNTVGAMDYIEDARMWLMNLQESKDWLEEHSEAQEALIAEIEKGKAWLEEHLEAQDALIAEIEKGKAWLEEHSAVQEAWIAEIEKGKAWLEKQWNNYKTKSEDLERTVSALERERDSLLAERELLRRKIAECGSN